MNVQQALREAHRLERSGKLEKAIQLYGKIWRFEKRPKKSTSLDGMWRLGLSIFEERRIFLEKSLAETKLTLTMERGLFYLRDIPQSLSLLSEYFYDDTNEDIFRSNTIKAIGLLDNPRRIPFLSDLLVDPNEKFRVRAVYALHLEESDLVLKPLKRALVNDSLDVRFSAIFALGERRQGDALAVALQQCKTLEEQYRLIILLGELKFEPAAPLIHKFLYVEDKELICLASQALTELNYVPAVARLRELQERFSYEARIKDAYFHLRRLALNSEFDL